MTLIAMPGGDGVPPEPDWLSLYQDEFDILAAKSEWGIVLRELIETGTVSVANGHMIERLVQYRVQFMRSSRNIAEKGTVLKAPKTGVPMANPHWAIMRQAGEEIRIIEVELGIPPVRRGKATKVQRGKKAARPSDAYLKSVAR